MVTLQCAASARILSGATASCSQSRPSTHFIIRPSSHVRAAAPWGSRATTKHSVVGRRATQPRAAADGAKEVYQGMFGPWSIEESDIFEVWTYRVGITFAASAILFGSAYALLPLDAATRSALAGALDPVCLVGAAGLGVSLVQIHIYIDVLKRTLQTFWAMGLAGGLFIMATQDVPAAVYVAQEPGAVWLVGPIFAALTGVAFKEGLCYNKPEAAGLFGAVPLLMLGHLSGLLPKPAGEEGMLASVAILIGVFAARKYTQPVKDDIGDKSVFMFRALPEAEQERVLQEMEQRKRMRIMMQGEDDE